MAAHNRVPGAHTVKTWYSHCITSLLQNCLKPKQIQDFTLLIKTWNKVSGSVHHLAALPFVSSKVEQLGCEINTIRFVNWGYSILYIIHFTVGLAGIRTRQTNTELYYCGISCAQWEHMLSAAIDFCQASQRWSFPSLLGWFWRAVLLPWKHVTVRMDVVAVWSSVMYFQLEGTGFSLNTHLVCKG